jgi:hypothetical protein
MLQKLKVKHHKVKELKAKSEEFEAKSHKSSLLRFFFQVMFCFPKSAQTYSIDSLH